VVPPQRVTPSSIVPPSFNPGWLLYPVLSFCNPAVLTSSFSRTRGVICFLFPHPLQLSNGSFWFPIFDFTAPFLPCHPVQHLAWMHLTEDFFLPPASPGSTRRLLLAFFSPPLVRTGLFTSVRDLFPFLSGAEVPSPFPTCRGVFFSHNPVFNAPKVGCAAPLFFPFFFKCGGAYDGSLVSNGVMWRINYIRG